MLKRLLRVGGVVDLESLPEPELIDQVREEARISIKNLGGTDDAGPRHGL